MMWMTCDREPLRAVFFFSASSFNAIFRLLFTFFEELLVQEGFSSWRQSQPQVLSAHFSKPAISPAFFFLFFSALSTSRIVSSIFLSRAFFLRKSTQPLSSGTHLGHLFLVIWPSGLRFQPSSFFCKSFNPLNKFALGDVYYHPGNVMTEYALIRECKDAESEFRRKVFTHL